MVPNYRCVRAFLVSVPGRGQARVGSVCLAVSLAHADFGFVCAVVGEGGDDVVVVVDCGGNVVFFEQSGGPSGVSAPDFVCTGLKCHRPSRA